ncbi:putative importin subunit alpha C [Heterostelium album PN500]|uniref:Importin subunit alpha n=1 Tax=Heterostelium pallidum (strain ATCC 26659 / Pp 5 / PN500) TaxID=670386 RepID=D3BLT4_HETP5|nr:putative importin subunit alpha C [Heterostelium album PN500]EFA77535.1 putative importin subunit alpha C [Heterostelium album PN500]|eukprot:XP_020429663.1 putative importin subunit alpha C [Heterostelium album PN500]
MDIDIGALSLNESTTSTSVTATLTKLKEQIYMDDPVIVGEACSTLRKMVSLEHAPPLDEVVSFGFVPRLLDLLLSTVPSIQCESCWVITNILSGASKYVTFIIQSGGLVRLCSLVSSNDESLREQVIWAIGNIAGDNAQHRDLVLAANVLPMLLTYLRATNAKLSLKRLLIWTVSNLCRGKPKPSLALVGEALPVIANIIATEVDREMMVDALWAMSYLSDATNEDIYEIIKTGVVPRIVQLLNIDEISVLVPSLRTFGNLVTGDDKSTLYVLSMNPFPALKKLLQSPKNAIIKETVWSMSNIVACSTKIIQMAIDAQMLPPLIQMLSVNSRVDLQKEILWCVSNLVDGGNQEQINYVMIDLNAFTILCNLLPTKQDQALSLILSSIASVFKHCPSKGELYANKLVQLDGIASFERIFSSPKGFPQDDTKAFNEIRNAIIKYTPSASLQI